MEGCSTRIRAFPGSGFVMRNLFISLFGRETGIERAGSARGRPETLRRDTIGANARIILAASALSAPAALYLLTQGALMPFVVTMVGLGAGFLTLTMHRRG